MAESQRPHLPLSQAYGAAYRFVWQYSQRATSPDAMSLELMVVAMEPTGDESKTDDPASSADWLQCVRETIDGEPLPGFPWT